LSEGMKAEEEVQKTKQLMKKNICHVQRAGLGAGKYVRTDDRTTEKSKKKLLKNVQGGTKQASLASSRPGRGGIRPKKVCGKVQILATLSTES